MVEIMVSLGRVFQLRMTRRNKSTDASFMHKQCRYLQWYDFNLLILTNVFAGKGMSLLYHLIPSVAVIKLILDAVSGGKRGYESDNSLY